MPHGDDEMGIRTVERCPEIDDGGGRMGGAAREQGGECVLSEPMGRQEVVSEGGRRDVEPRKVGGGPPENGVGETAWEQKTTGDAP